MVARRSVGIDDTRTAGARLVGPSGAHRAPGRSSSAHCLACARGLDNQTVAKKLRVSPQMVGRWRARFVTRRVDGLLDEPRPGSPMTPSRPSRRCAMSSGCISTRPIMPWCCVSMKNRRFRLSTAHSPCCRCSRAKPRATRIPIAPRDDLAVCGARRAEWAGHRSGSRSVFVRPRER